MKCRLWPRRARTFRDRRAARTAGVTLVEVVMAVLVLSVAATIGVVTFDGRWSDERQLEVDAQHVRQTLRTIRNTAIAKRTELRVNLDTSGGSSLRVQQAAGPLGPAAAWTVPLDTTTRLRMSPRTLTFRANGSTDRNANVRLSRGTSSANVDVIAVNGVIQ